MTDRQKQHLLAFLGFYGGAVDGIWGEQSRQATVDFQCAYMESPDGVFGPETQRRIRQVIGNSEKPAAQSSDFWKEITCFSRAEFRCTCGGRGCDGFPAEPSERLVRNAQTARVHFGKIADVSSGVRCQLRNAELPGSAANSLHLRGKAMDFRIRGIDSQSLCAYVRTLPGVDEAYAIDSQYVHMGVEKYERGTENE
ncbi:MAG: peptidoglycan-binding protein [Oscillospiraceae bacterium]|nr:peptidoglycan-binding protein [Oscillospiraceae bacterium]